MRWLRRGLQEARRLGPPLPLLLIALLCFLPELALWASPQPRFLRGLLLQNFAFWPGVLGGGWQPNYSLQGAVMFLTYGFLHADVPHFLFNMITLFSLGRPLVADLGQGRFFALYAAGLVGGGLGYALLSETPQPMVGASGALFGLAGGLVWRHFVADWQALTPLSALRAALWPITLLVGMNVVMYLAMNGQLAWEAHLGGALAGVAAMVALWRNPADAGHESDR